MPIYVPKQIIELTPTNTSPLLFLAGPIRGGGDWQAVMAETILDYKPEALIACPSRWSNSHKLHNHFHQPFSEANNRQLEWERHYLHQAGLEPNVPGCVIFWLGLESKYDPHPGPEPFAMDTRRELGKFIAYAEMTSVRLVIGGNKWFHGLDVILFEFRAAFKKPFPFYESMSDVAFEALAKAQQ